MPHSKATPHGSALVAPHPHRGFLAPRTNTDCGGKGHSLVPWLLDAHVLPTLGGGDAGGTGGRLQPVLMRHTPQLSVKTRGGSINT